MEVIFKKYEQWGYGMSAIVRKSNQGVVGFCGLVHPHDQVDAELKYALCRDCWGEGIATEAVKALLSYGRRQFMIEYLIATVNPSNLASQRVLVKAGMIRGQLRPNADGSITQMYTMVGNLARLPPNPSLKLCSRDPEIAIRIAL
jgi:RimJ/RimL family protein N-acetyltransferase